MTAESTWSTKDKLIGAGLLLVLLSAVAFLVIGHVKAFTGPDLGIDTTSSNCIPAQAEVLDKFETGGKSTDYKLKYSYRTPEGKEIIQEEYVDLNLYTFSKIGDEVAICYLADDPDRSALMDNDHGADSMLHLWVLDGAVLLVIVLLIRSIVKRKRKKQQSL